jgi:predicted dehydrogenase
MTEYGVGIIGMGFMGKTHAFAHRVLPFYYPNLPYKTRLITACNRSPAAAEHARDYLGFENATTNEDDVFSDDRISLVHICTPNEYHFAQVKKALDTGKNVYCDKPLTVSYAQAHELAILAKHSGKCAQVAFQNRFFPATLRAKQLVDEGKIGHVLCFRCEYLHSGAINADKPAGWKQRESGGVLRDLGSHAIDLICSLVGEFESVYCSRRVLYPFRPDKSGGTVRIVMEDHVTLLLTLPSGATGTIEASKIATGIDDELRFEIHGTKGALKFNLMQPNVLWFYDNTKPEAIYGGERGYTAIECTARYAPPGNLFPSHKNALGWIRAHCHSLYTFVDNVHNQRPGCPSFEDGAYVQLVIDKAFESSEKKAPVKIK